MTVLIAGCGDLGTEAGLRFVAAGHDVVGIRRRTAHLPEAFGALSADLAEPLPELPGDLAVVVYAAAPNGRDETAYRRTFVDGPRHLLDALERTGRPPARLLFVSSTAVYGVDDGSEVDEATPAGPTSRTGAVLVEAEQALLHRRPDAVVLRLAGIYGPGRTRLLDQIRAGTATVANPDVHTNRIHRDDAARAIVHLTTTGSPPTGGFVRGPVLGVDHEPAKHGEVLRFLADQLEVAHPPVGPAARSRGGDKRCRNIRLLATGFTFAYPTYREGYRAVLAGHGSRHP